MPLQWAVAQDNLGVALRLVGERDSNGDSLKRAVKAHRDALGKATKARAPLQWATIQDNLGQALRVQATLLQQYGQLDAAVNAHQNALKERRRERVPLQWAATKDHLGAVYAAWTLFPEAKLAYEQALEERKLDRVPLQWAETQHRLAHLLRWQGTTDIDPGLMCRAVGVYTDIWRGTGGLLAVSRESARGAKIAVEELRNLFGESQLRDCIGQYAAVLGRMGLTF